MDNNKLADLLFPNIDKTPEYYEKKYPARKLEAKAEVTRYAPSPTGFVHFGALFTSLVNNLVAKKTNGVFFLRIEDTDKKREVEGGVEGIINTLSAFDIKFDEGAGTGGEYGPYIQSERQEIYQTYAKELVRQGKAYPCFCTAEELEEMRKTQEANKENIGYYHFKYAKCRYLTFEEIKEKIDKGEKFVIRFKCPYTVDDEIEIYDAIRGKRFIHQNGNDVVILKSNGLPPYNFAHVIDDHLMHTTFVIRGDEWLPSLAEHLQLFEALGFTPPKYAHLSPIQKIDENGGRRKLSKRKDPEADMNFFAKAGYPVGAIKDYIMTLVNSDFEPWRQQNKTASIYDFPFSLQKMNASGALFDIMKLKDISKNYLATLSQNEVYDLALAYAKEYNEQLYKSLTENKDYWLNILSIDRNIPKPRKDLSHFEELYDTFSYMFEVPKIVFPENFKSEDIKQILSEYPNYYNENDDQQTWFNRIKDLSEKHGFAREVKEFKNSPEKYKGHCGDVSTIIRVALTGRTQTPNLFDICKLLGKENIKNRCELAVKNLK